MTSLCSFSGLSTFFSLASLWSLSWSFFLVSFSASLFFGSFRSPAGRPVSGVAESVSSLLICGMLIAESRDEKMLVSISTLMLSEVEVRGMLIRSGVVSGDDCCSSLVGESGGNFLGD